MYIQVQHTNTNTKLKDTCILLDLLEDGERGPGLMRAVNGQDLNFNVN